MYNKNQINNYIIELKRIATKKRGIIPDSTSKNYNIQKLTEEKKKNEKKL